MAFHNSEKADGFRAQPRTHVLVHGCRTTALQRTMQNIYISKQGQQHGPYTVEDLNHLLETGQIDGADHFWREGEASWKPLSAFPGFTPPKGSVPPPPPSPPTSAVPSKKKRGGCLKMIFLGMGTAGLLAAFVIAVGKGPHHPSTTSSHQQTSGASAAIAVPAAQGTLVEALGRYAKDYKAAANQLQKSALRTARARDLERTIPNRSFSGWLGTLKELTTTSDGKAAVVVELVGSRAHLRTWNNALSDVGSDTLIPQGTSLYQKLSAMSPGNSLRLSGEFLASDKDYLKEASMTEQGSMTEPEFVVKFSSLERANP